MGGRLSRHVDASGHWRTECSALEEQPGYKPGVIWEDFCVSADLRQRCSVALMPREVHEEMAWRDVLGCFNKRGLTESVAN